MSSRCTVAALVLLAMLVACGPASTGVASPPPHDQRIADAAQLRATDVPTPWRLSFTRSSVPRTSHCEPRPFPTAVSWAHFAPRSPTGEIDSVIAVFGSHLEAAKQLAIAASTSYRDCRGSYLAQAVHGSIRLNKLIRGALTSGVVENVYVVSFKRAGTLSGFDEEDLLAVRGRLLVSVSFDDYDLDRVRSGADEHVLARLFKRLLSRL